MAAIKTNGKASTEFKVLKYSGIVAVVYVIFLILAKNVFHWEIPEEANGILGLLFGGGAAYSGSRGFYKGMLAKVTGSLSKGSK